MVLRLPLLALMALASMIVLPGLRGPALSAPNILLIIADDMGLDASPCYDVGAWKPAMPNLERLCREGLVFDNFYAAPMCSPTRATIMTGRYGFRTGVGSAVGRRSDNALSPSETTLFQFLDAYADDPYAHGVVGKWHLSNDTNGGSDHPRRAGVGYYAGVIEGTLDDYYDWPRTENGSTEQVNSYVTTAMTDDAITWIAAQEGRPWFLWLAYVAPHLPLHVPPQELHTVAGLTGQEQDIQARALDYYFAALEAMDSEMGRLLDSLPNAVRDDTVVFFIGDNGTPNRTVQPPFERRRAKASLYEGGTHVPLIVAGKGVTRQGKREAALVNSTDLFATIAQLAGIDVPAAPDSPEDSISFAPLLTESGAGGRRYVYTELFGEMPGARRNKRPSRNGWAIRDDRWKYLHLDEQGDAFYDLASDPFEQDNLLNGGLSGEEKAAYERLRTAGYELRAGY
ncbi:sulfatase-like hydrolase/transferase [Nitratireductor sp. XY-223]|uniref:sulfatase-like hydrolase/transferase n=1 Tax=Nitratireductor sp. XY-223 TaxID=2561926 RepID=UPI0010AA660B|nr:sulfatase-like hydrolase/transferase [Nitratireductor sp. XY-223]